MSRVRVVSSFNNSRELLKGKKEKLCMVVDGYPRFCYP